VFLKKKTVLFFFKNIIFVFFYCFNVKKINFKNKKNYFDAFLSKNSLKNNIYHNV